MKFSIITCTYNSEKYIRRNIDSIKNQSFKNFEHIFIDGFSSDKTTSIIKSYQKEFPEKVKLFQFKPRGIGNAMNIGINKSSGKYIIHLHSDDSLFSPDTLKEINAFILINKNPYWIYGKALFINEIRGASRIIPHRKIYHKAKFWLLLATNYIPHQSVFIQKKIFKKYGYFNEKYKNSMDYEMWLRLLKNNVFPVFFNKTICNFFIHPDSQSTKGKSNNEHNLIHKQYLKSSVLIFLLNIIDKLNKFRS